MSFYEAALHHRTGDIIFSRDRDLTSWAIRVGHLAIDRRHGRFSHVTLCAFPGLFIDSIPKVGVRLFNVEDRANDCVRFNKPVEQRPAVLRLPSNDDLWSKLIESIAYWTGQEYSFRFISALSPRQGEAYCSQFISQVLTRAGALFGGESLPPYITPSALYERMLSAGCSDVTDLYAKFDEKLYSQFDRANSFGDGAARWAVKTRLEQEIRTAITSNISVSTTLLVIRRQKETSDALARGLGRKGGIYGAIDRALSNQNQFWMCYGILHNHIQSRHWKQGLTDEDKTEASRILNDCFADVASAIQEILDEISLIEIETRIISSLDRSRARPEEIASVLSKCTGLLCRYSLEKDDKVDSHLNKSPDLFPRASSYKGLTQQGVDYENKLLDLKGRWHEFKRTQLSLRRIYLDVADSIPHNAPDDGLESDSIGRDATMQQEK